MTRILLALIGLSMLTANSSCKKEKSYDVPAIYSFEQMEYSQANKRLQMITELVNEVEKANSGQVLDAQVLQQMYVNLGNHFSHDSLNLASGVQLKNKTFQDQQNGIDMQAGIESILYDVAAASVNGNQGSKGVSGIVSSGSDAYLLSATGWEYAQGLEMELKGGVLYYQITAICLGDNAIFSGDHSARLRSWDYAFGYFGVPADYPTNTVGVRHLGKYTNDRNAILTNAATIMSAFLKGRAALENDDEETVREQIPIIRDNLERVLAATIVHYLNVALANMSDDAIRNHNLSAASELIFTLHCNPTSKLSLDQVGYLLNDLGSVFYDATAIGVQSVKDMLSTTYGFDSVKDQL